MSQLDSDERILVTGGSGFIGTNLITDLIKNGSNVLNIDIAEPRCNSHYSIWRNVDLRMRENLFAIIKEYAPTQIYHLGAKTDLNSNDVADYSANTSGVTNLIDACVEIGGVKRVIFASSRLVCKIGYQPKSENDYCPTTAYGESKVLGEQIVREYQKLPFDWVIARPTSIWGPWFDVPYRLFFDHVKAGRYVHPMQMEVLKSFGFVGNSVFQLKQLMAVPSNAIFGKTFYIGDYVPIEVGGFAKKIAHEFGIKPPISIPLWVLSCAAKIGDLLVRLGYKNAPLTSFRLSNLQTEMIHDFTEISLITGQLPYTTDEGIRLTINWMNGKSAS
jgi:nucleoside-diphosphate-sugar epimerase